MPDTTDTNLETGLAKLSDTIAPIVAAHAESEAAKADELAAQVALVSRILEIARPAVRALGSRPLTSNDYIAGEGGVGSTRASWRGLILTCEPKETGPTRDKLRRDDNDGSYEGCDVFLRDDGQLVELTYSGSWSNWQNSRCGWTAEEETITVEQFCRTCSAAEPDRLVAHLQAIADAAGDRVKATKATLDRAVKYRAILALL